MAIYSMPIYSIPIYNVCIYSKYSMYSIVWLNGFVGFGAKRGEEWTG